MANPKDAVVFIRGVPHYELTAETIAYPLPVSQNGRDIAINFVFKPYDPTDLKAVMKEIVRQSEFQTRGDETEFPDAPLSPIRSFVDRYFVRLVGTNSDDEPARHKAYLDRFPWLKDRIYQEGILSPSNDPNTGNGESEEDLFILDMESTERNIATLTKLFSSASMRQVEIKACHHLRPETDADYRIHRRSVRSSVKTGRRKRSSVIHIDHDALAGLYDSMVIKVDGFVIGGKKCTEENAKEWKPLIPLVEKLLVVDIAFERTSVKNV